jgi:hypothetical protein
LRNYACPSCGLSGLPRRGYCRPCGQEVTRLYRLHGPKTAKRRGQSKHADLAFQCEGCGKQVAVRGAVRSQHRGRFCSMKCVWRAHVQAGNPKWRGGRRVYNGYAWVMLPPEERTQHTCGVRSGRYIPEHRLKVERVLGRCLRDGEAVHHINGDKLDNRNENLLVCSNSYHAWLHAEMSRRYMREKFGAA